MACSPDEKEDRSLVHKMVKKDALTGKACGGSIKRAKGGATKGKPSVNIVIAPRGGQNAPAPGVTPGPVVAAPSRPAAPVAPVGPAGGLAALRGAPVTPPAAKRGGKIDGAKRRSSEAAKRANGGSLSWQHAGAQSAQGREEKIKEYGVKPKTKLG